MLDFDRYLRFKGITEAQKQARLSNWTVFRLRGAYALLESLFLDGHLSAREFQLATEQLIAAKGSVAPKNNRAFGQGGVQ